MAGVWVGLRAWCEGCVVTVCALCPRSVLCAPARAGGCFISLVLGGDSQHWTSRLAIPHMPLGPLGPRGGVDNFFTMRGAAPPPSGLDPPNLIFYDFCGDF